MRHKRLVCVVVATLFGLLWIRPTPEQGERYQGLTARQWEAEIRQWQPWCQISTNKTGSWTFWARRQPFWISWLRQAGFDIGHDRRDMPLLQGDATAVPILAQLLTSDDPQACLLAAEGLEKAGERALQAVSALLVALDDEDKAVRQQAEQALFGVDREAAERVGLEWTNLGLVRR